MPPRYRELAQKVQGMLRAERRRTGLYAAMKRGREAREQALLEFPGATTLRHDVRTLKEQSIARLDELIATFTANAQKRGAVVFEAATGEEAARYVVQLAKAHGVKLVAKSKSLTTEEIELNHYLEAEGIRVVETDLGERIIQLAHEKPYHLVFPAVHHTKEEVAELFARELGQPVSAEFDALMQTVRGHLRKVFLDADMGVSGGNVAIAETGGIVLETNEGNARLITSIPDLHVAIVGIEKLVPHVEDAAKLITAHPLSATGQRLTVYVSMLMGARPLAGASQRRQQHIVLLDNGRRRMRADAWFREGLYCIRCGACMNICPTYGVVGGHVFGHIYPGPIGIPWTAEVHGLEQAAHFAPLCISCGLCKEICPADIDMPMLIARVKERDAELHGHLLVHDVLADAERFARLMQATAPLSNWILRRPAVRYLLDKAVGLDRRRPLPAFVREPFEAWYRRAYHPQGAERQVVYFVDLYANYNDPALGRALVGLLAQYGLEMVLPAQKSSGMPFIAYGKIEAARQLAAYNVRQLYPWAHKGLPIVATEPTAAYMLRLAYPKLLDTPEARVVAEQAVEPFELLAQLHATDAALRLPQLRGRAGFHISCHQRALGAGRRTVELLRRAGMEIDVVETGTCCGMAGTFGLKRGPVGYDLSMEVGRPLFELFAQQHHELIVTESSVCRMHLEHGTRMHVVHPVKLWLNGFADPAPTAIKQPFEEPAAQAGT